MIYPKYNKKEAQKEEETSNNTNNNNNKRPSRNDNMNMNDDDDEEMAPPKPTLSIGSPTPSEKAARNLPALARIITTASLDSSPEKNKKQKVKEEEKETI